MATMRYRLALDLGSASLGWAMLRLNADDAPCAVIKAGVRIFSDGRNPKDGSSLAVTRHEARAMRRRRDRLLKRKTRMMHTLVKHGFFPSDAAARKALELLNPYQLRAKGLDSALTGPEFARALFHINQRRGFKSNRKTDKKDNDSGALKTAISKLRQALKEENCRTVGEWLHKRDKAGETVRARFRQTKVVKDDGKTRIDKSYDLYIDRAMIENEFDALWAKQADLNPGLFTATAASQLKDCLLHQRPLKPTIPGRCTLLPTRERAPLALPSTQRFRMYQEVNNLRILRNGLKEEALTLTQRNLVISALEQHSKRSFTQIKKLLDLSGAVQFNIEDAKRSELKGNTTGAILGDKKHFGEAWQHFSEDKQDAIVLQLVREENEAALVAWLQRETGVEEPRAEAIANCGLPEGFGSLCTQALARILPPLRLTVITYDKAVLAAGFEHHSHLRQNTELPGFTHPVEITNRDTGEIKTFHVFDALPYYGAALERHVGFGSGKPEDAPEKRFGKIANPTVHIGLNQVRLVVNALVKRYGHPNEVIVELARDLKQSRDHSQKDKEPYKPKPGCSCQRCVTLLQAANQQRNERIRQNVAGVLQTSPERVKRNDIQKWILWEELCPVDAAARKCPYSGVQISCNMLLSDQVEIEHILPYSETLDDSLNNQTVALRKANRVKGNRTPWQARDDFAAQGWDWAGVLERALQMPLYKRYRMGEDGMQRWLKDEKSFLARALNDTRYLSRIAREYLSLVCPQNTRVIPGRMTALLRAKFGLNDVLGTNGIKNRNDHRHHAVDACVIAVTDQGLLQRFAAASASAREQQLDRLVEKMPLPWETYRDHVQRAIQNIWVSHKPNHGHEGAMHNDTAYGLLGDGKVGFHKMVEGKRTYIEDNLKVIEFTSNRAGDRHGKLPDGQRRPYKGYKGDSNYCIEIVRSESGKWEGEVISTFEAYQFAREHGVERLRHTTLSLSNKSLVMRLIRDDFLRLLIDDEHSCFRVTTIKSSGEVLLASHTEANVDARNRDKNDGFKYLNKSAGSMQKIQARRVTISPIGELRDPGFSG